MVVVRNYLKNSSLFKKIQFLLVLHHKEIIIVLTNFLGATTISVLDTTNSIITGTIIEGKFLTISYMFHC